MALVAERGVEASERERQPVADGRDAGDVEAVQADLGRDRLVAKLLDAGVAQSRTTKVWIEAVAVAVAVAFHLEARAGREPRRERLVGADRELVESEVETAGLRADPRVARELRHHLDAGVVVRRADEEPRDADAPDLGLRQPDHFGRVLSLELDLALAWTRTQGRRRLGREGDGHGRGAGGQTRRLQRPVRLRLLEPLEAILHPAELLLEGLKV